MTEQSNTGGAVRKKSAVEHFKQLWWPALDSLKAARKATMMGVYAAGITIVLTLLVLFIAPAYLGSDAIFTVVVGIVIYGAIGIFIWQNSRIAAVLGLAVFVLDKLVQLSQGGGVNGGSIVIMLAIGAMYASSIRGTFARRRLLAAGAAAD
jgi:hypothetical protein